jgi:hypothetical protein
VSADRRSGVLKAGSTADGLRTADVARGAVIALISLVAGYWILVPNEDAVLGSFTGRRLAYIGIAVALQVGVMAGNWGVRRYERAHGMEGQIAPDARHVLQLLADGVSVLLFALAVFGGIVGAANSI